MPAIIKSNVAIIVSFVLLIISACAPTPTATPTLTPTVTNRLVPQNNENAQTLTAAQAALSQLEYGFAPLLQEDQTRLVVENGPDGEFIKLAYPRQADTPAAWISMDSFVLAYAVRDFLFTSAQTRRISLGKFDVAAPVDGLEDRIAHYAAWIRFADGSEAIVDLSPLATNFAARHRAAEFITDAAEIESQFTAKRAGVPLNILQPMKVVTQDNNVYYLVAKVLVLPDRYEFSLRVHLTQTATPIRPLQLTRGTMATVEINRSDFETVRELMVQAGPAIFNQRPELLSRAGNDDPTLTGVLDEHLSLLWHMVIKLAHDPSRQEAGTPVPTMAPTPTSTPTPTPTPTALPLLTS